MTAVSATPTYTDFGYAQKILDYSTAWVFGIPKVASSKVVKNAVRVQPDAHTVSISSIGSIPLMLNDLRQSLCRSIDRQKHDMEDSEIISAELARDDALLLAKLSKFDRPSNAVINDASVAVLSWKRGTETALLLFSGDGVATLSRAGINTYHIQDTTDYLIKDEYAFLGARLRAFLDS